MSPTKGWRTPSLVGGGTWLCVAGVAPGVNGRRWSSLGLLERRLQILQDREPVKSADRAWTTARSHVRRMG